MSRSWRAAGLLGGVLLFPAWPRAVAQRQAPSDQRCLLELVRADRDGTRIEIAPGVVNLFVGGNVRFRCRNLDIRMQSDSVASYQGNVVQFIGRVRYQDSTITLTADFGTYLKGAEKWEARGNVALRNLKDGTVLRGPMLDYWRSMPGVRDTAEMYADRRPTVTIPVKDSTGTAEKEPYTVVGDRIRTRGEDRIWAGGRVTIDRSDFRGRGDSLYLDTGAGNQGALIGAASVQRTAADSFDLTGSRIDLALAQRELTYVTARDSAQLHNAELRLDADVIGLDVEARTVTQTLAWGETVRPLALSADYEIRGDSLAFDTPDKALKEVRAFGRAWIGAKPDSGTGDRDWILGDTVTASFAPVDTSAGSRTAVREILARGQASALYRLRQAGQAHASLSYNKADLIRITLKGSGDSTVVDSVRVFGNVEGVHLQPGVRRPDSVRADTTTRPPPASPPNPPDAPRVPRGRAGETPLPARPRV